MAQINHQFNQNQINPHHPMFVTGHGGPPGEFQGGPPAGLGGPPQGQREGGNEDSKPSVGVLMRRVFYLTALFVCMSIVFGVLCTLNSQMGILQHDSRTVVPNCTWALQLLFSKKSFL